MLLLGHRHRVDLAGSEPGLTSTSDACAPADPARCSGLGGHLTEHEHVSVLGSSQPHISLPAQHLEVAVRITHGTLALPQSLLLPSPSQFITTHRPACTRVLDAELDASVPLLPYPTGPSAFPGVVTWRGTFEPKHLRRLSLLDGNGHSVNQQVWRKGTTFILS